MHVVNAAPDRFTNGMRVRGVQSFTARRGRGEREGGVSPLALLVGCAASLHARCNTQPLDHRNVTLLPCGRLIKFHFFTSFLFFLPSKRDLFERERERECVSRAINTGLLFSLSPFFQRFFGVFKTPFLLPMIIFDISFPFTSIFL